MLLPYLSDEELAAIEQSIREFKGHGTTLESALGALILGNKFGWRALKMCHSPATLNKYEKILGISYNKICPEKTELSKRSFGLVAAEKLKAFWSVATGKQQIKNKADFGRPDDVESQITAQITKKGATNE